MALRGLLDPHLRQHAHSRERRDGAALRARQCDEMEEEMEDEGGGEGWATLLTPVTLCRQQAERSASNPLGMMTMMEKMPYVRAVIQVCNIFDE